MRRIVGYRRVSTRRQQASWESQQILISASVRDRGDTLVELVGDYATGGDVVIAHRPGLRRAIELLRTDAADVLIVTSLDRLDRTGTVTSADIAPHQLEVLGREIVWEHGRPIEKVLYDRLGELLSKVAR